MCLMSSLSHRHIWLLPSLLGMFPVAEPSPGAPEGMFTLLSNPFRPSLSKPLNKLAPFCPFRKSNWEESKTNELTTGSLTASHFGCLPVAEERSASSPRGKAHSAGRFHADQHPQPPGGGNSFNLTAATQICVSVETQVLRYFPYGLGLWVYC